MALIEVSCLDHSQVRDLGDGRVLGIGSVRTRGRGSGIDVVSAAAGIATFRDGALVHWKDYGNAELAREAAGLSE